MYDTTSQAFPAGLGPLVIYDGECPFCSSYVRLYRLQTALGSLKLLNARELSPAQHAAVEEYDLDEGMIFVYGDRVYHGSDAVHAMALVSSPSGFFNRFNALVFRSGIASRVLYPILRLGRNATLWLLGVRKISRAES